MTHRPTLPEGRIHIKLKPRERFLVRGVDVPGNVWQERPFNFNPIDFAVGGERLHEKIFDAEVQSTSLARYFEDPRRPLNYGVASAPSDAQAKYFAAYLVQYFLDNAPPNLVVRWEQLYGDSFKNPALDLEPSLLVITGLTPNSSATKLEKARDLIEKHTNIPKIVVIAGEDPVTFFSTKLYSPIHNIYFHSSALIKRRVEIT